MAEKFLFNLENQSNETEITSRIRYQVSKYMPYISLKKVSYNYDNIDSNALAIYIEYSMSNSEIIEVFDLSVTL